MSNCAQRAGRRGVLLPVVLGAVYLGGWWLFALVAIAAAIALHEYWLLGRGRCALAPAGYVGAALALVGAQLDGVGWMLGGVLTTFVLAFVLKVISEARASGDRRDRQDGDGRAVDRRRARVLDPAARICPTHGRLALYTVLARRLGRRHARLSRRRLLGRHKMAPSTSPGKTWEGFVFGTAATVFVASSRSTSRTS